MKLRLLVVILICGAIAGCRQNSAQVSRRPLGTSGWVEEDVVKRGYVKPGDIAQFGCPPGWHGVEDTAAAMRGRTPSTIYMGADPPPGEATITCVAQAEFALPKPYMVNVAAKTPARRPLAPVWLEIGEEATTIGFRSELPLNAALHFARETPCGARVIGVRLGDLLNWLTDPQTAPKRDFLGMLNGGC